jgi:hypothetical protein
MYCNPYNLDVYGDNVPLEQTYTNRDASGFLSWFVPVMFAI